MLEDTEIKILFVKFDPLPSLTYQPVVSSYRRQNQVLYVQLLDLKLPYLPSPNLPGTFVIPSLQ